MKSRGCICFFTLFIALLALRAEETPSVEIFTGWAWMPYSYCGYPYRYGYAPYGCSPFIGIEHECYPGLYDPYASYWGYDYSVRYRLRPDRTLGLPEQNLPCLPGSAPTELLSSEHKTPWDQAIDAFLKTTNTPPSRAVAPQ